MGEEHREYRRNRTPRQRQSTAKQPRFLKKLLRQSAVSLAIFAAVFGLKTADPDNTLKITAVIENALTDEIDTSKIQNIIGLFTNAFKTSEQTKEGTPNETPQAVPLQ